jgi:hypothetical protein
MCHASGSPKSRVSSSISMFHHTRATHIPELFFFFKPPPLHVRHVRNSPHAIPRFDKHNNRPPHHRTHKKSPEPPPPLPPQPREMLIEGDCKDPVTEITQLDNASFSFFVFQQDVPTSWAAVGGRDALRRLWSIGNRTTQRATHLCGPIGKTSVIDLHSICRWLAKNKHI